jgi:putative ABC transport system permease protein
VAAVVALEKQYLPDPGRIKPDASVFAFTLGLAVLAAVLVSVGVAWHSAPGNMYNTLKESAQNVDGGRKRLRSRQVLVIGEFAAAFVLLIGAGTLLKSLANLARINPGFNPDHVLTMRIPLSPLKYTEQHPQSLFLQPMLETIGALPGVESAAIITYLPMQAVGTNSTFEIEGKPKPRKGEEPWAEMRAISPDYFRTMGIHLLRGRRFTDADSVDAPAVLVVNSAFVKDYFHDEDPIGRKIISTDESVASATIVGVVEDSLLGGLQDNPRPEADLPYPQARWSYLTRTVSLAVRTRQDPLTLAKQVQQAIYSLDSNQGVYGVKTMNDIVANTETDQRFVTWQLGIFSALALILAAAGLFGLISYSVSQRRHEIGVRMALGAQQSEVLRMIVGEGAKLTALGMALGRLASFGLTRLIGNLLYGVRAAEPVVMATSAFVLASIALLACYIPARRATRVDPLVALRYE